MPKSLFGRSLLILVLPTFLAQAIAVYIFYERHWDSVSRHMAASLAGELAFVAKQVEATPDMDLSIFQKNLSVGSVRLGDSPLHRGSGWKKIKYKPYSSNLKKKIPNEVRIYRSTNKELLLTRIKMKDGHWLEIITSNKRLFNSSTHIFIIWMLGSTALLTLISVLFLKNQIRPIIRLARFADTFGRGQDFASNFSVEGAYEVRLAGTAFVKMRSRLRRFIRQRTEMLAGISHDLRTPLTRLKLEIEMLKSKLPEDTVKAITNDINEMQQMIESYINFVRSDEEEETREVNIGEVIRNVAGKFRSKGAHIEIANIEEFPIMIKEGLITRALSNLLENAIKYADRAKISVKSNPKNLTIIIEDNGPGIPEAERDLVFRPFYRVENSRNPETGGSGLGLAIVQDVIHSHGGNIELADSEMGGLLVKIKLPL